MTLRRRLLRELAYLVILGTPVALFFLVAMPRSNAVRLLKSLTPVRVDHTTFNQVESLADRYGGYAACVGDNCLFQFQNEWLHRLHLAPRTEFTVMLQRAGSPGDPGGGTVGAIDMAMLVSADPGGDGGSPGGAIASALVFDRGQVDGDGPGGAYQASITFEADGRPERTVVMLTPGATARQRTRARAFAMGCLTRLGGCKTSHDLLPSVWQGVHRIQSVGLLPFNNSLTAALTSAAMPLAPVTPLAPLVTN